MPSDLSATDLQMSPDMSGISFQEFVQILRRRRVVVAQAFVLVTVVAIVLTLMTKPVYEASARLLVEPPSMDLNTVDNSNPLSSILALTPPQSVETQVEAMMSPSLMTKVIQQTGPATVGVKQIADTNVIEATAQANDPEVAAKAANTLLQLYIDQDVDRSLGELRSAEAFVRKKEEESRARLNDTSNQLENFKQQHHITELQTDRAEKLNRVASLTDNLHATQISLAAAKAQAALTQAQIAQMPANRTAQVQTTNTEITTLNDQLANLQVQREGMTQSGGYTDKAPVLIALDAEIAQVKQRLASLPAMTKSETISPNERPDTLTQRNQDLAVQEAALQTEVNAQAAQLATTQAQLGSYAGWEMRLARLTLDYNSAAEEDKMFADHLSDLSLREQAHHSTASIDEDAVAPGAPIRPKKAFNITLGMLFGLFVGVCLALVQEFLDDRINTVEDANRVLGLPSLGFVPTLTASDARLMPQMKGLDPAAESYRLLRTNIQFAAVDAPIHTLLVTSSGPGEGKTTTAANLAFAMALDGKNVILVDTDLRRPSLHKLLGLPTVPGLTDVLLGRATLDDTLLEHADMPNMVTLSAGSTPPNPSELLNSRRFHSIVDEMRAQADIVIFDSPPVNVASDAAILGSQMDGTILVIEAGETRKAPARHAVAMLQKGRANILGLMYNKMRALDGNGYYYYRYNYTSPALPPVDDPESGGSLLETVALASSPAEVAQTKSDREA